MPARQLVMGAAARLTSWGAGRVMGKRRDSSGPKKNEKERGEEYGGQN